MPETELRELRRHTISMVFQNYGLFPHRKVIDNVAFGLEVRGASKEERYQKATEMIELVGVGFQIPHPTERGDETAGGPGPRLGDGP